MGRDDREGFGGRVPKSVDARRSGGKHWSVVTVKCEHVYSGFVVEDRVTKVGRHYVHKRSLPCLDPPCPGCAIAPARWYVYLPLALESGSEGFVRRIVTLPIAAWHDLQDQLTGVLGNRDLPLLGTRVKISRPRGGKKGRVICELMEERHTVEAIEPDVVMHSLCKMWGLPVPEDFGSDEEWKENLRATVTAVIG